jgi:hypothetical protein
MLKLKQKDGPPTRLPALAACVVELDCDIELGPGASPSPAEGMKLKLKVNWAPLPALKERLADPLAALASIPAVEIEFP